MCDPKDIIDTRENTPVSLVKDYFLAWVQHETNLKHF